MLQEDGISSPALQKPAETVPARPRSGRRARRYCRFFGDGRQLDWWEGDDADAYGAGAELFRMETRRRAKPDVARLPRRA